MADRWRKGYPKKEQYIVEIDALEEPSKPFPSDGRSVENATYPPSL